VVAECVPGGTSTALATLLGLGIEASGLVSGSLRHSAHELKERLDLFVNHPSWYMERGIPYSLGILLHGVPGAGKTSTIKAIAKDTNRHIFNLSLRPYTTQRQLTNLFFNETVTVQSYDGAKQTYKIPLNKRVYVIEDIDCLTDVVLDRSITKEPLAANKEGEAVTLSFLLNLLDGVLETPGRILVITSNYPDKLDKALVRPGRIDVRIEFRNATRSFILDMVNKFYSVTMTLEDVPDELEDVFTPAEVMESMCQHFKSPTGALAHLSKKLALKKEKEEEGEAEEKRHRLMVSAGALSQTPAMRQRFPSPHAGS
jgi:chaperone BCS1